MASDVLSTRFSSVIIIDIECALQRYCRPYKPVCNSGKRLGTTFDAAHSITAGVSCSGTFHSLPSRLNVDPKLGVALQDNWTRPSPVITNSPVESEYIYSVITERWTVNIVEVTSRSLSYRTLELATGQNSALQVRRFRADLRLSESREAIRPRSRSRQNYKSSTHLLRSPSRPSSGEQNRLHIFSAPHHALLLVNRIVYTSSPLPITPFC
ncbi:hypothetical protein RRG08_053330 [Elysia crispata]|uniref:Uncharacterized protein n=1 Tax=Elysia crispata TaxID=231223 RepID=A0AAE0ZKY5_9GAST|nr:hypothetical protein RRG08_053330 [Elysia crispata]